MPGKHCEGKKHTPIVSKAQQRLFGAVAGGKKTKATGLSITKAKEHQRESKGKDLPARARTGRALRKNKRNS